MQWALFASCSSIFKCSFYIFMSNNAFILAYCRLLLKLPKVMALAQLNWKSCYLRTTCSRDKSLGSSSSLIGMVGIEFSDLQRFLIKWALGTTAVMTLAALILGVISI